MAKVKITKKELTQMIKEEYLKKLTEVKLKNRLHQINEEIKKIISEDETLEEVEAGGKTAVRSTGWTGEKGGDEKWKPEFQKKGSHLVEDATEDEFEVSDDMPTDEMPGEDMPTDDMSGGDMPTDEMPGDEESLEGDLDIEAILAQLADAIEDKIETTVNDKLGNDSPEEVPSEEPSEEIPSEDEGVVEEQDGTSVVQGQKPKNAVPFDNGAATIHKADQLVSEGYKKRAQILAGIKKNDFND